MTATRFQLTMRSGPVPGKTFLLESEETTVGRDLSNDIPISDPEVSRRHARFFIQNDNAFVEDLGSTNGTFLNGERIDSPQQLRKGDVITFGESVVMAYDKQVEEPDITDAHAPVAPTPEPEYVSRVPEPMYAPEEELYLEELAPYEQPEPEAEVPEKKKRVKEGGMPTWMIILLVAIVVLVCVIAVTLYFMPASWWCAITFDLLAGCPLP